MLLVTGYWLLIKYFGWCVVGEIKYSYKGEKTTGNNENYENLTKMITLSIWFCGGFETQIFQLALIFIYC